MKRTRRRTRAEDEFICRRLRTSNSGSGRGLGLGLLIGRRKRRRCLAAAGTHVTRSVWCAVYGALCMVRCVWCAVYGALCGVAWRCGAF